MAMATRRYWSAIRTEQAEQTRAHLVECARDLLAEGGVDGLTLPLVAKRAGVSVPTVYRHFPTLEDLLRGVLEWLRPAVGQSRERLLQTTPEALPAVPLENFRKYDEHAAVLLPLMDSRAFNRVRVGSMSDRKEEAARVLRTLAPEWRAGELEAAAGAVYALCSPQTWRWLRETWALPNELAAEAASWAVRALLEAVKRPGGLAQPAPAKKTKKSKKEAKKR